MSRLPGAEPADGQWYAVPLPDATYALCVVTYFDGSHFAGFYFGPAVTSPEALRTRPDPDPLEAKLVAITEQSGIRSGRWVRIGRHSAGSDTWELPEFIDHQGSTLQFLVRLAPGNYSWYVSRRPRPADDDDPRRDGYWFNPHRVVENEIADRLQGD